jgi:hypothetical protein
LISSRFSYLAHFQREVAKTHVFSMSLRHCACNNLRSAKRIVMKFDIGEFATLCPHISILVKIAQQ